MQSQNRFFEDLSKIANGAAGTIAGMGREMEAMFRQGFERFMSGMDFVSREEFEAVKSMAAAARAEVEALKARLDAMQGGVGDMAELDPTAAEARKRKPRASKPKV